MISRINGFVTAALPSAPLPQLPSLPPIETIPFAGSTGVGLTAEAERRLVIQYSQKLKDIEIKVYFLYFFILIQ